MVAPEDAECIVTKTAFLHIGTHKTGTTSIQQCLAEAERSGGLAPYSYPLWKHETRHNRLIMLYYAHRQLVGTMREMYPTYDRNFRRVRDEYRRFIFNELASAGGAIISGEPLSGFPLSAVTQLRTDLESVGFRRFHVVIYIRDPADYYLSRTQQALKEPGYDPSGMLSRTRQGDGSTQSNTDPIMDPATFVYDFRRAVDTWEHVFPNDLIVRRFPNTPDFDVIADFGKVLQEHTGVTLKAARMRMNTTLSAEAMQILQDYRRAFEPNICGPTPGAWRIAEFLRQSADQVPQTKPVLQTEVAEQIRASHRLDAELLRTRYKVDLGLANCTSPNTLQPGEIRRVDELVESVNPAIVHELLIRAVKSEFGQTTPPLPMRIARRAYHALPPRPQRLVRWSRNYLRRPRY